MSSSMQSSKSNFIQSLTVAYSDIIEVTRSAGIDTGTAQLATGIIGAPIFLCSVKRPGVSPELSFQTPDIGFMVSGSDAGKIIGQRRVAYDPTSGYVRFYVEATAIASNFNQSETWEFSYSLAYKN